MTTTTISPTRYDRMFQATALVALVVAIAALILVLTNRPTASSDRGSQSVTGSHQTAGTADGAALRPGGSVYDDQVPRAAWATINAPLVAGGSVYDDQVPAAARTR